MAEEKKLVIEIGPKSYTIGGDGTPKPDSVGSREIENDSVQEEDLAPEVRDKLNAEVVEVTDEEVDEWFNVENAENAE